MAYSRRQFLAGVAGTTAFGLDDTLEARQDWIDVGGRRAYLYGFNGRIPGPVMEVKAGEEVRLRFRNSLSEVSNLHFHGLHVPSMGNADNIMVEVPPGEAFDYRFTIPADHPSATCWYHPHVHGLVARQVSRGMAGVIVVRNPELEAMPEIDRAPEAILVLQDFAIDSRGYPTEPLPMARMDGREGSLVTVSGMLKPELLLRRDGWLRLRIVNASSSRFYRLQLEEHPFYQIASDGGYLAQVEPRDEILLSPGERVEVMVRGDRPPEGTYRLLSLEYDRGSMMLLGGGRSPLIELATLRYEGVEESPWELPGGVMRTIEALPEPDVRRSCELGRGAGMTFTLNGRAFSASRVDFRGSLGTVEEWEFVNPTTMDHPMHIHTDPFQVAGVAAWRDTVVVPANGRVRVRTALRDFEGMRMYHCHILDHEDLGMMGVLEVGG